MLQIPVNFYEDAAMASIPRSEVPDLARAWNAALTRLLGRGRARNAVEVTDAVEVESVDLASEVWQKAHDSIERTPRGWRVRTGTRVLPRDVLAAICRA